MLSASQLHELASGSFESGSHAVNHRQLAGMAGRQLEHEERASKASLEDVRGRTAQHLAYPQGSFVTRHTHLDLAQGGIEQGGRVSLAMSGAATRASARAGPAASQVRS